MANEQDVNREGGREPSGSGKGGNISSQDIVDIVNKQIEPFKQELNEYKIKIVEILGIFVALFTFVSVDIQVFKEGLSMLSALGFTLIMLGSLVIFVIILVYFLNDDKSKERFFKAWFGFSIFVILVGIVAVGYDYNHQQQVIGDNYYTKQQTDQNIASSTINAQDQLDSLKICLENGGWSKCFTN